MYSQSTLTGVEKCPRPLGLAKGMETRAPHSNHRRGWGTALVSKARQRTKQTNNAISETSPRIAKVGASLLQIGLAGRGEATSIRVGVTGVTATFALI
ncbi:MAG: hypothetical protein GPOALKHO_000003 [Sodalis sp.]|nr:MAG: hypothetical protein GPOALKHO_000003 [Sodalis sp.]